MPRRKKTKKQPPAVVPKRRNPQPARQRPPRRKKMGLGAQIGSHVGDFVEQGARGLFRTITGIGDYKVDRNSILSGADPPVLSNGKRVNVIRHREYIGDVTGSVAYVNTTYALNPGNSSLFPWLYTIAQNYEQYVFHGVVFEFKSTSADALNSTNTALGTVIMATEYNVNNNAFTNKIQMENCEFTTSCKPSECMMHPIECSVNQTPTRVFYTRPVVNALFADLRFVDMGNFQLATVGMQAAANIGELWVTYEVELLKPFLTPNISSTNSIAIWSFASVTTAAVFGNSIPLQPAGNAGTLTPYVSFGTTTFTMSSTIYFPIGSVWTVFYTINGGAVTPVTTVLTFTNATATSILDNGAGNGATHTSVTVGGTDTFLCLAASFTISGNPVTLTWNGGTYPTANGCSLTLCRIS